MSRRQIQRITTVLKPGTGDVTSLQNAKLEFTIAAADTTNDSWFNLAIPQITAAFQQYTNRQFAQQGYQDLFRLRRPDGALAVRAGADPLMLSTRPVVSIAALFDLTGAQAVAPPTVSVNPATTLAAPMAPGDTVMTLTALLGPIFPFNVLLDTGLNQEVVQVTGPLGASYTVVRAQANTTAVAHAANVPATQGLDPTLYELDPKTGFLQRLMTDGNGNFWPVRWGTGEIVVYFTAGYIMPGQGGSGPAFPGDLEEAALRHLTARYRSKGRDPTLRAEGEPGIGQQQFWVGTVPGQNGAFAPEVQSVLDRYHDPSV